MPNRERTVRLLVTVMIGRNVGARPMPVSRWNRFRAETKNVLRALGDVRTTAVGRYEGSEEWSAEDTALYVLDTALGSAEIQRALVHILARYEQEAAGIIVGDFATIPGTSNQE